MSQQGKIAWFDLTVEDTDTICDFYRSVVGWQTSPVDMGDYNDYHMLAVDGQPAAGICHKRGINAEMPSTWMIYITVDDLAKSITEVEKLGGKIRVSPQMMGKYHVALIEDPVGTVFALYEAPEDDPNSE